MIISNHSPPKSLFCDAKYRARVLRAMVDKGKKSKVDDDQIDGDFLLSIEKLQAIQDELEKINEEASDKVIEVDQQYNEIRRPVYARRNEVIKAIPDFWLTAFLSHPALGELLNEEDQKIFKYLASIDVADSKDVKSGYSITLNFSENPYFENTSLTKTYSLYDEGTTDITGTEIKWKDGMDIVSGVAAEKNGGKRPLTEESFFSWFSETQPKNLVGGFSDEVSEIIKEELWPNPLKYFNNEHDEEDFDEEEDEEEDDEKVSDFDDDEDGDEEEG